MKKKIIDLWKNYKELMKEIFEDNALTLMAYLTLFFLLQGTFIYYILKTLFKPIFNLIIKHKN